MKGSKNKSEIGAFMGRQVELKRITIKASLDRFFPINKEKIILTLGPLW